MEKEGKSVKDTSEKRKEVLKFENVSLISHKRWRNTCFKRC